MNSCQCSVLTLLRSHLLWTLLWTLCCVWLVLLEWFNPEHQETDQLLQECSFDQCYQHQSATDALCPTCVRLLSLINIQTTWIKESMCTSQWHDISSQWTFLSHWILSLQVWLSKLGQCQCTDMNVTTSQAGWIIWKWFIKISVTAYYAHSVLWSHKICPFADWCYVQHTDSRVL